MENKNNTPSILFLVFNRFGTASRVFEVIRNARPSRLYIAADGPRPDRPGEKEVCQQVRDLAKQVDWPCELHTLFREKNLGCTQAIITAIDWFFEHEEDGIILEDDCLPRQEFFPFCKLMLDRWRNHDEIMMIAGTNYLFGNVSWNYDYYFSRLSTIWGWATWKRSWQSFSPSISEKNYIKDKRYIYRHIKNSKMAGWLSMMFKSSSCWDCLWSMTMMKNKRLSVVPIHNLITNIGIEGTHTDGTLGFTNMPTQPLDIETLRHPNKIIWDEEIDFITFKTICDVHFTLKGRVYSQLIFLLNKIHILNFCRSIKRKIYKYNKILTIYFNNIR